MSLTPDVERRLHSVLDQGIDYLKTQEPILYPRHTASSQSLLDQQYSESMKESSGTLETILKQPNLLYPDTQTHYLQGELETLQSKIAALEVKLKTSPPPLTSPTKPPRPKTPPQRPLPDYSIPSETRRKIEENDTIDSLKRENERLKEQLMQQENLLRRLTQVQEDYNLLAAAYEKSERLRRKQKEIIEKFKSESEKKTTNAPVSRHSRAKSVKKERKTRSTSRKSVRFRK